MTYLRELLSARLIAVLASGVLALGAAACGSDDSSDGGDDGAAKAQGGGDDAGEQPIDTSTPEGQVRAVLAQWTEGLQQPDPKLACSVITPKVEKQLRVIYSEGKTCEDIIRYLAPNVNKGTPEVLNVDVKGAKATMGIRSAQGDRQQTMEFTKSGGEWKISDGFGEPPKKVKAKS